MLSRMKADRLFRKYRIMRTEGSPIDFFRIGKKRRKPFCITAFRTIPQQPGGNGAIGAVPLSGQGERAEKFDFDMVRGGELSGGKRRKPFQEIRAGAHRSDRMRARRPGTDFKDVKQTGGNAVHDRNTPFKSSQRRLSHSAPVRFTSSVWESVMRLE